MISGQMFYLVRNRMFPYSGIMCTNLLFHSIKIVVFLPVSVNYVISERPTPGLAVVNP